MSVPMRVPDDLPERIRPVAAILGEKPGELLDAAFNEWLMNHRDEVNRLFDHTKKFVASKDQDGLRALLAEGRAERAQQRAARARAAAAAGN